MLAQQHKAPLDDQKSQRKSLGLWLRLCREEQGLSQRELAERLSLDYYTFISQLENGRGKIPVHRYEEWAHALGQDPKDFVKMLLRHYEPTTHKILFDDKLA
jgi:transcriptional regulator with XRE-family HTH domain